MQYFAHHVVIIVPQLAAIMLPLLFTTQQLYVYYLCYGFVPHYTEKPNVRTIIHHPMFHVKWNLVT